MMTSCVLTTYAELPDGTIVWFITAQYGHELCELDICAFSGRFLAIFHSTFLIAEHIRHSRRAPVHALLSCVSDEYR